MRVMVMMRATAESEAGVMPTTEAFEEMSEFNRQLVEAGVLMMGEGLRPSATGKRVEIDGPTRTVLDGPFAETKELVAGFAIWRVKDMEEALAWIAKWPNACDRRCEIELRPLMEFEDWNGVVTPEIAERESRSRPPLSDY